MRPKLLQSTGTFNPESENLSKNQKLIFRSFILVSVIIKILIIPYNMMDMGDSATRVWNAWWWAQNPSFILPVSGHPFWFYFMGPILMMTREIFYTPIIIMIILMTIAGIYLFKTALMLSNFKTAFLTFCIFLINPVIFRLNFEPYSQQTYLTAICIMIYFFLKAICNKNSIKNFVIAGVFSFIASSSRPEAIFVLIPLCIIAFLSKEKGYIYYIVLTLLFQILWIFIGTYIYGSPFKTFQAADQYTEPLNIQNFNIALRLKGFFLPYYFLILGVTIILFWFFIKGIFYSYKNYPTVILIILLIPVVIPALVNGAVSVKSTIYHTTHYIYLIFFFSSFFTAIGLNDYIRRFKSVNLQFLTASIVIISCIPFSYIKDFVPQKYNKLFPKIIQFIATTEDPEDTRKMVRYIDEKIKQYPSLIFDAGGSASSVLYVPFRTKLAPPEKILITSNKTLQSRDSLATLAKDFMNRNGRGIIMVKKEGTALSEIITNLNNLTKEMELNKWVIYIYR